jgi:hypothetical protein
MNEVKESKITILKNDAIKTEDFRLAIELDKIEMEWDKSLVEARRKGLIIGFGTGVACVIMGGVVTKIIIAKRIE